MKATLGMRHAVLWVSDPHRSAEFYNRALGLETKVSTDNAVFMSSPASDTDHDLGLFRVNGPTADGSSADDPPTNGPPAERPKADGPRIGLYHIAWEVETLTDLAAAKERLTEMGALVGENNHGVSRSLYVQDPDGIEFEVMWELPVEDYVDGEPSNVPLDLEADMARFGAANPGRGGRV